MRSIFGISTDLNDAAVGLSFLAWTVSDFFRELEARCFLLSPNFLRKRISMFVHDASRQLGTLELRV